MKFPIIFFALLALVAAGSSQRAPTGSLIAQSKVLKTTNILDNENYGLNSVVDALVLGKGPGMAEVIKSVQGKMEVSDALQRLKGKLPAEVTSLVAAHQQTASSSHVGPFDEASLKKALKILNHMIEEAWKDLDNEIIKCKEFEDRNRGTFDQVMTDLARLGEQIADLERQKSEANENIHKKELEFLQVKWDLEQQTVSYTKIRWSNAQEMTIRKNDLEVMTFVLELTKCKDAAASLAQVANPQNPVQVCSGDEGQDDLFLRFDDPELEEQLERKMTPRAMHALREALGEAISTQKVALVETDPTTVTTTTTEGFAAPPMARTPVRERVSAKGFWKICKRGGPVDCGLLHDTMSIEWGKFKDSVDELQHEMDKNQAAFLTLRANLNSQMEVIIVAKGRFMMMLAESVSNLNADQNEQAKKTQQRNELNVQYYKFMAGCKRVITEITFTRICAVVKVRNEVMGHSETIDITDCDVTSWVPGDCSVLCDDSCPTIFGPNDDPYKCGGWQTLAREVIQKPNEHGVTCPALSRQKKCNQQKCPVNCEQSMWSGWSKCTKDCESGVHGRTRSILAKPKNGGESCNTVSEEEACNTGSCDRDCLLEAWTEWGFCTMACGGGLQERTRRVDIPTRGEGVCPKDMSPDRYGERACNTGECIGDEICIAKQDLVIAIDGSGSLRTTGFDIIRDFAAELIDRYKSKYFDNAAMKIGVVLFGNGEVLADGTVSGATRVAKITDDLASVKTKIEGLKWQRGFTNMAQALTMAENMFLTDGRKEAQSAVMVITDGKPTLLYETQEKVMKLKDKAVKLFFAPVTEAKGEEVALMKKWASQPWQSHLVHVPGLMPLKADGSVFASKFIATFCPEAMSPSATMKEEDDLGYFLLKESAICGDVSVGTHLADKADTVGDCAAVVRRTGEKAFSYGQWYKKGYCYSETFPIDDAKIADWKKTRESPNAPCEASGGWIPNSFYDTYVLETV
jgi:uncharacterized protein YegL